MTDTTQIATGVIQLIQVGRDIYKATANTMDADKKVWVHVLHHNSYSKPLTPE